MTQAELAQKARVSRSFIIGLERGTNQGAEAGRIFLVLKALGLRLTVEEDTSPTFEEAFQDLLAQGLK
jgi:transcriptional regulator with XRE-family HTH domain